MLYRLVYMSSATERVASSGLDKILGQSRHNNAKDGITGLLIFHDGNFLQVLEGEKDSVLSCYRRISTDRRHSGCILLNSEEITERMFKAWDMASLPFSELASTGQEGFLNLQELRHSNKMKELEDDKMVKIMIDTFLGSFRNLRLN